MKIKPLFDRCVLKPIESKEKNYGGLILPSSADEKTEICEVVAVGPGRKDEEMILEVGNKVIIRDYAGTNFETVGERFKIVMQQDVIAIIEE